LAAEPSGSALTLTRLGGDTVARNLLTRDSANGYRQKQVLFDALYLRSNIAPISSGQATLTVTFTSTVPDTNYTVAANFQNTTDTNPQFQPITITAKTTGGFTAKWNANTDTANYSLTYQIMPLV